MTNPFVRTRIATAVAGFVLALGAGQAAGAGFMLQENSGSGLGNAYAGGAAASEDADTIWTNPAGMARLKSNQVALALNLIGPSMKFHNDGNSKNAAPIQPLGSDGGNAGVGAVVPNAYLVLPINPQWAFGIGLNAPFGLTTEYDNDWIGRYQAIKSKIETINVNPAISYRSGNWAIGAGANYQHIKAEFTQATNYSGQLAAAAKGMVAAGAMPPSLLLPFVGATAGLDGFGSITGDDDTWGWNIGGEWGVADPNYKTRIGASYRSSVKYHITGNVNFSTPSAPTLPSSLAPYYAVAAGLVAQDPRVQNGGISADVKLPDFANVSFFHTMLNDKWDFMADVQWTNWSTIQDLTFVRTTGTVLASTPYHWKDAWRVSGGVNYRYTDKWMFRGGIAWDQSPVPDQYRSPRLPDNDRIWLTGGVQYVWDKALKLDLGAAYIFIKDPSIAQISPAQAVVDQYGYISGNYNNYTFIVSGQVTWNF